jgi:hypothetical protein
VRYELENTEEDTEEDSIWVVRFAEIKYGCPSTIRSILTFWCVPGYRQVSRKSQGLEEV